MNATQDSLSFCLQDIQGASDEWTSWVEGVLHRAAVVASSLRPSVVFYGQYA